MHTARRLLSPLLGLLLVAGCSRGPTRDEALAAIRAAHPTLDGAAVQGRVWQDGPPWFSCFEVSAKIRRGGDGGTVDPVRNWRALVASGWVTIHDTAKGPVVDPGWCTVRLTAAGQPALARWRPIAGDTMPTGTPRRGWEMLVGQRRVAIAGTPKRAGGDSAHVEYLLVLRPNADGVAVGADGDTSRVLAQLQRVDGQWRVTRERAVPAR